MEPLNSEALRQKKIGVLMGGLSSEREISLKTGEAILRGLLEKKYRAQRIDVDHSIATSLIKEKIEVAFIALHGQWGEDGTIQGMLEMMGIPYTGSGVLASALAMDKVMAKKIFSFHRIPTPEFQVLSSQCDVSEVSIDPPVVIKPASGGSTIGISVVKTKEALQIALRKASAYDQQILVEKYVDGVDITVGILNGEALPVIEILPKSGFYDYDSKYTPGKTEYIVPAEISQKTAQYVQHLGIKAYEALQCSGAARVDFLMDRGGDVTLLEINTIPGLTETSLLPMAAGAKGLNFPVLIEEILLSARLHLKAHDCGNG